VLAAGMTGLLVWIGRQGWARRRARAERLVTGQPL
jgi:hypothetical protein